MNKFQVLFVHLYFRQWFELDFIKRKEHCGFGKIVFPLLFLLVIIELFVEKNSSVFFNNSTSEIDLATYQIPVTTFYANIFVFVLDERKKQAKGLNCILNLTCTPTTNCIFYYKFTS